MATARRSRHVAKLRRRRKSRCAARSRSKPSTDGSCAALIRKLSRYGSRDGRPRGRPRLPRSEEHTSELQSLMRISYAVFCLKKKNESYRSNTIGNELIHQAHKI